MTQYTLTYLPTLDKYSITTGERLIEIIPKKEDETPSTFRARAIQHFNIFISGKRQLLGNPIIIKTELA